MYGGWIRLYKEKIMRHVRSAGIVLTMVAGLARGQDSSPDVHLFWSVTHDGTNPNSLPPNPFQDDSKFKMMMRLNLGLGDPSENDPSWPNIGTKFRSPGKAWEAAQAWYSELVTKGWLDANSSDFTLLLQNFGDSANNDTTALFRSTDALTQFNTYGDPSSDLDWPGTFSGPKQLEYASKQPWMTDGRANAKDWMETFLDLWNTTGTGAVPAPARAYFDTEIDAIEETPVGSFLFHSMVRDQRWSQTGVPGFPKPTGGNFTMAELWHQSPGTSNGLEGWGDNQIGALDGNNPTYFRWSGSNIVDESLQFLRQRNNFNITSVSYFSLVDLYLPNSLCIATNVHNREYYVWYDSVMRRAIDGAMYEAAYAPLKGKWENIKVLNYDTSTLVGTTPLGDQVVNFGWHVDKYYSGTKSEGVWTKQTDLGIWSPPKVSLTANPADCITEKNMGDLGKYLQTGDRWNLRRNERAFGDYSSPVLYAFGNQREHSAGVGKDTGYFGLYAQPDPYLPLLILPDQTAVRILPVDRVRWGVSLREARRTLESIIQSSTDDPRPWEKIAPWIAIPGSTLHDDKGDRGFVPDEIDIGLQLQLFREKQITQFMAWDDFVYHSSSQSTNAVNLLSAALDFQGLYHDIYDPQIVSITAEGGCDNAPTA